MYLDRSITRIRGNTYHRVLPLRKRSALDQAGQAVRKPLKSANRSKMARLRIDSKIFQRRRLPAGEGDAYYKKNTLPFLMNDYSRRTASPAHEEIEVCAYFIYVQEGRPEGSALDHWLQAELQLATTRMHEAARELCSVSTSENSG